MIPPPPHWLSLCHIKAHLQRPRPCTFHKWQNLSTDKIPAVKSANVNCFSSSNLYPLTGGAFKYERINAASWGIFQPSTLPPDSVVRGERSGGSRQTRLSHPWARDRKGRRPSSQVPTFSSYYVNHSPVIESNGIFFTGRFQLFNWPEARH